MGSKFRTQISAPSTAVFCVALCSLPTGQFPVSPTRHLLEMLLTVLGQLPGHTAPEMFWLLAPGHTLVDVEWVFRQGILGSGVRHTDESSTSCLQCSPG